MADTDWTDLALDRDTWQAIANMVKLRFAKMWRVCWLTKKLVLSQKDSTPCSQSVSWLPIIRYLVYFPCIYWRSLVPVYTQAHNTHHAFFHNAKFFFKSLYHNSGTLTARRCRIFSKCNNWLTRTWHSSRLLINVSERKHTDHIHVIKLPHYTQ